MTRHSGNARLEIGERSLGIRDRPPLSVTPDHQPFTARPAPPGDRPEFKLSVAQCVLHGYPRFFSFTPDAGRLVSQQFPASSTKFRSFTNP